MNRFNGFRRCGETLERVKTGLRPPYTSLKRGANKSGLGHVARQSAKQAPGNSVTTLLFALALLWVSFLNADICRAAESANEQQLIALLQASSSPQEKDAACVQLKKIATPVSIPALAALLDDPRLSQSACYVLESMDATEAGRALIQGLNKTSGPLKAGIINSLGNCRETEAVGVLRKALGEPNAEVAAASAVALGKIGGQTAVKALTDALPGAKDSLSGAVIDGLLRAANELLGAGQDANAKAIFKQVFQAAGTSSARGAAYAGLIRSAGRDSLALITKGIEGIDPVIQSVALQLAREIRDPNATTALANLLPQSAPAVQCALIEALSQRGDPSAAKAVAALAGSETLYVRAAALEALGTLGDSGTVPLLIERAASEKGSTQAVARRSLSSLNRGPVAEALLTQLKSDKPSAQTEAARALGERGETASVPTLFSLAAAVSDATRRATLQALASLVAPAQLDSFVQLVVKAPSEAARQDAAAALNIAYQRIKGRAGQVPTGPLVKALNPSTPADTRAALFAVCSGLPDPEIRGALRSAIADSAPQLRTAAIRAMCDTSDPELLPDLLKIACSAPEENFRTLAIARCVRLTSPEEGAKLTNQQRLDMFKTILASNPKPDQKRLVLSGLAEIPDPASLALVEPMLADDSVRAEAARALVKIAPALSDADAATVVLKKVMTTDVDSGTRNAAQAALKQIDARSGFITSWQVAGPYRQANKNFSALFDIPFPPETPEASGVEWRNLPAGTDPSRPWSMDVLKFLGGEQCVAYARTRVFSSRAQPVRLEIGSDDGAKIWINDKLVHANNTARPLQPAQDKADAQLQQGWNHVLLKLTQNNLGWEFCLRITAPDGSRLEGLRVSVSPNP